MQYCLKIIMITDIIDISTLLISLRLEVLVQMEINYIRMIELFSAIGTVKWCHGLHKIHIAIVSDRRSAILLVKGKLPVKSEDTDEEKETAVEIKIYAFFIPASFVVMIKLISKLAKSRIVRLIRKLAYDIIIGVVKRVLVDIILSLIRDKEKELQVVY